jgi:cysteine desulfurase
LMAMGVDGELARGAVRLSLGAANTTAEVESFLLTLQGLVKRLKGMTAMAV